jgi:hypothetical protein
MEEAVGMEAVGEAAAEVSMVAAAEASVAEEVLAVADSAEEWGAVVAD